MFNRLIPVKQNHIDKGICGNEYACAITLAIDEAIPGANSYVSGHFLAFNIENFGRFTYETTDRLGSWISRFDNDKTRVTPITLKLWASSISGNYYADVLEPDLSEEL